MAGLKAPESRLRCLLRCGGSAAAGFDTPSRPSFWWSSKWTVSGPVPSVSPALSNSAVNRAQQDGVDVRRRRRRQVCMTCTPSPNKPAHLHNFIKASEPVSLAQGQQPRFKCVEASTSSSYLISVQAFKARGVCTHLPVLHLRGQQLTGTGPRLYFQFALTALGWSQPDSVRSTVDRRRIHFETFKCMHAIGSLCPSCDRLACCD